MSSEYLKVATFSYDAVEDYNNVKSLTTDQFCVVTE